jgi:hypothetical protein
VTGPLSDRARLAGFLAAAAIVIATPVGLSPRGHHGDRRPETPAAPVAATSPPTPRRPVDPQRRRLVPVIAPRSRGGRAVAAAARRFAHALLAYEAAGPSGATGEDLASTCTPPLRRALLAQPPRHPQSRRPPRGRLLGVRTSEDVSPDGTPALVTVRRGRRTSQFLVVLERTDARWRASSLGG